MDVEGIGGDSNNQGTGESYPQAGWIAPDTRNNIEYFHRAEEHNPGNSYNPVQELQVPRSKLGLTLKELAHRRERKKKYNTHAYTYIYIYI